MKNDFLSLFTESPSSLGINEITMQFSGDETEKEYIHEGEDTFISHKRISLIIGVVIFLVFGGVDYLLFPRLRGVIWFIRFAIVIPTFLMVFSLSYIDKFKHYVRKVVPYLVLIMSFAHLMSLRYIPFEATASFYSGYILLILYSFIFMRSGFIPAVVDMLLMALFYGFFVIFNDDIEAIDKIIGVILVLSTCLIGIMYTYLAEYHDRKHFALKKRHDFSGQSFDLSDFPFEEAIIFVNENGECKYLSKQVEHLIAHNKESILDNQLSKIFSKKDKKRFEESVKIGHTNPELLEEHFHVLNKGGISIPLSLTVTAHKDASFGEGYIIIMSNPELAYSSAKLLSDTQQLLREHSELGERKGKKKEKKQEHQEKKAKKDLKLAEIPVKMEPELEEKDLEKESEKLSDTRTLPNKEDLKKIEELEAKLEELTIKNDALYRDIEALRKENTILRDLESKQITANSLDRIKLMSRMASFVSSSMDKKFGENINYLSENEELFKESASRNYIDIIKNRMQEGFYLSAAVGMRFDLFQEYSKNTGRVTKEIELCQNIGLSISQMARYFENTNHMVDVSCKDNIMVRMNQESFKRIFQNLVMNGLIACSQVSKDALIEFVVTEEKSKIIVEYKDNGKLFPSYYSEIIKLKDIDANVLSVNGVEFFFAKEIMKRECAGEFNILKSEDGNRIKMVFMK